MRRVRLSAAILVAASLVLAGCGGDDKPSDDSPAAQEIEGGSTLDSTWPLTGLPVEGDDSAAQNHPVMVTKIDNTASSAPQIGLGSADLVVEELVEGGLTRLAAFFYSELPDEVGPVRSMRASDIGIVSPVDASVVTSGAAGGTIARIKGAGIKFYHEGAKGDLPRHRPQRAVQPVREPRARSPPASTRTSAAPTTTCRGATRPTCRRARRPRRSRASFGGHATNWEFKNGKLRQREHLRRRRRRVPGRHRAGAAGPGRRRRLPRPGGQPGARDQARGQGRGAALPRRPAGARPPGARTASTASSTLSTKAGELTVPAGHTWIELVPAANGNVTFK